MKILKGLFYTYKNNFPKQNKIQWEWGHFTFMQLESHLCFYIQSVAIFALVKVYEKNLASCSWRKEGILIASLNNYILFWYYIKTWQEVVSHRLIKMCSKTIKINLKYVGLTFWMTLFTHAWHCSIMHCWFRKYYCPELVQFF